MTLKQVSIVREIGAVPVDIIDMIKEKKGSDMKYKREMSDGEVTFRELSE